MNKTYIHSIMKTYRSLLWSLGTLILILASQRVQATHIVGGNISYRCITKDIYEVTVIVRRDCLLGDPEAYFDNPASIGIFDKNGELLQFLGVRGQLLLKLQVDDTLTPAITENICTINGTQSVCVHEATYKGNINLPYRAGGYYLMYQRCCRNMPIQNITEPLQTGGSWVTYLSEEAMTSCNTNPVFNSWSPIFLCAGKPFNFDHAATDKDGDSLVYKIWSPYTGATKAFPLPQPPNKPDFKPVSWQSPYSEADMMGGDPFRIDARTGMIHAVPNTLGLFLLGVQVEEYRNGKLIGTVYRDFEVKVIDCSNLIDAKINAPDLQCDDLTINFKNESTNATHVRWYFDYDRNLNATSTEFNPTYRYTDTGTYRIALVITKDSACFDTAYHVVHLKSSASIKAAFGVKTGPCKDGFISISLTDQSSGVDPTGVYTWTVTYGGTTLTSTEKNPVFSVPNGVLAVIKLEIAEEGSGCFATATQSLLASFLQPGDHLDSLSVCTGDTVKVNFIQSDSIRGKYNYAWDPSPVIIGGANTPEPIIRSAADQEVYIYATVDNKDGCTGRDSILIRSLHKPKLDFIFSNLCGSLLVKVINRGDTLENYLWNFGDGTTSLERAPEHTYAAAGRYTVTLSTTDDCGTSLSKSFDIGNFACLELKDTIAGCEGRSIQINPFADPAHGYTWRPTDKLNNLNIPNPSFVVDSPRIFVADIYDLNTGIGLGTHTIWVINPLSEEIDRLRDTVLACAGQGIALNPGGNPVLQYIWSPAQFLDNPTAVNPVATVSSQTIFTVMITNPADSCVASTQMVVLIPTKIAADLIPDSLEACINIPVALNPNGIPDTNLIYLWSPANKLDNPGSVNPKATIDVPTLFTVTIRDKRFVNCQVTETVKVRIPLVEEVGRIKDSFTVCAGVPIPLNPGGDARYVYEWSPAAGLDNPNSANPTATPQSTTVYTVKITDTLRGGCFLTKEVKVKVVVSDAIGQLQDTLLACLGQGVALNPGGNPNLKYIWSPAQFLDNPTAVNPIATVSSQTVFTVMITNPTDSCIASAQVVVVLPIAVAAGIIPDSLEACINIPVALNPGGLQDPNLVYLWSPANKLDNPASVNPKATIDVPTVFTVTIRDTRFENCQLTKSVKVRIPLIEEVGRIKDSFTVCAGVPLPLNPGGDARFVYEWSPAAGLDNPNSTNPTATPQSTTVYTVKITDTLRGGCFLTKEVKVKVAVSDAIGQLQDTLLTCLGQGVALNPGGDPNLKYIWSPAQFLDNPTAVNPIATVSSQTVFTVMITNPADSCVASAQVVVVLPIAVAAGIIPDSLEACINIPVALNPNGIPDTNLIYLWSPANKLDNPGSVNPKATIDVPTLFTVTIRDKRFVNCQVTETVKVRIPLVEEVGRIKDSFTVCAGVPIPLNPGGDARYVYEWSPAAGLDNPNSANPTATPQSTTVYTVKITDTLRGGCFLTKEVKVKVVVSDAIGQLQDTLLACLGQGVALNPGGNPNLKYIWSPAQFLDNPTAVNPIATVSSQTVFTVMITNPTDSCIASAQVVVVLPIAVAAGIIPDSLEACINIPVALNPGGLQDPNLVYLWSPANKLDNPASVNPKATIDVPTVFTVTIRDTRFENCQLTKSVKVRIPLIEEVGKIKDSLTVCAGVPTPLNPGGDARFVYEWSPATGLNNPNSPNPTVTPVSTTVYSVKVTDTLRGGCFITKEVRVTVPPAFTVVPSFRDTVSCSATGFRLRVASDNPRVTFEWFNPAGTSIGKGDTLSVNPTQRTTYRVTGTDEFGCQKSDTVRVDPAPVRIAIAVPGGGLVCQGDSIRLTVTNLNPAQVLTYSWTPATDILSGANTSSPLIRPTASRKYYVTATNQQGCRTIDSAEIRFSPVQQVTVTANPTTIVISQTSQITATNVPGYTYRWSPAEGLSNPNISNPVAKPLQTTTYTLTVTNPDGCVQTRQVTITVQTLPCARPNIFLPNAFTPNGDGKNDVLYLRGVIVESMSLIIYNRWGQKIFESKNQSIGWDGTFNGKLLDPDVYAYYLTVNCIGGEVFTEQGNVTILR